MTVFTSMQEKDVFFDHDLICYEMYKKLKMILNLCLLHLIQFNKHMQKFLAYYSN